MCLFQYVILHVSKVAVPEKLPEREEAVAMVYRISSRQLLWE